MKHKKGGAPYSMDANLLHISYEGRHLEDPAAEAEESDVALDGVAGEGAGRAGVPRPRIRAAATSSRSTASKHDAGAGADAS